MPLETVEEVLRLYQETYFDLNVRHFHEKLGEEARDRAELHLGAKGAAGSGSGGQAAEAGTAPAAAAAAADAGDAAAHRRQQASVAER